MFNIKWSTTDQILESKVWWILNDVVIEVALEVVIFIDYLQLSVFVEVYLKVWLLFEMEVYVVEINEGLKDVIF